MIKCTPASVARRKYFRKRAAGMPSLAAMKANVDNMPKFNNIFFNEANCGG
jgi:hypothetical protein